MKQKNILSKIGSKICDLISFIIESIFAAAPLFIGKCFFTILEEPETTRTVLLEFLLLFIFSMSLYNTFNYLMKLFLKEHKNIEININTTKVTVDNKESK